MEEDWLRAKTSSGEGLRGKRRWLKESKKDSRSSSVASTLKTMCKNSQVAERMCRLKVEASDTSQKLAVNGFTEIEKVLV